MEGGREGWEGRTFQDGGKFEKVFPGHKGLAEVEVVEKD